jgi:hypothetical protein
MRIGEEAILDWTAIGTTRIVRERGRQQERDGHKRERETAARERERRQ